MVYKWSWPVSESKIAIFWMPIVHQIHHKALLSFAVDMLQHLQEMPVTFNGVPVGEADVQEGQFPGRSAGIAPCFASKHPNARMTHTHTHVYIYIHTYIHIYIYVRVCVCVQFQHINGHTHTKKKHMYIYDTRTNTFNSSDDAWAQLTNRVPKINRKRFLCIISVPRSTPDTEFDVQLKHGKRPWCNA